MGAKIQAFDILKTPFSSHYPLPLSKRPAKSSRSILCILNSLHYALCRYASSFEEEIYVGHFLLVSQHLFRAYEGHHEGEAILL